MVTTRRNLLKATGLAAVGVSIAGCSDLSGSSSTQMRWSITLSKNTITGRIAQWIAEGVDEQTDGNITIENHFDSELGGNIESVEGVSGGSIDGGVAAYTVLSFVGPDLVTVFDAPYLGEDLNAALDRLDPFNNETARSINEQLVDEANIRVLPPSVQGMRRLTLADEPAKKPADLKGRPVRAVGTELFTEMVRGLGAQPENISLSDLPTALATGTVDGQENPYLTIWNSGFYENQDYVIHTNHAIPSLCPHLNESVWQDLSEDEQDIFVNVSQNAAQKALNAVQSEEQNITDEIRDAGLTIIPKDEIEYEAFRTRTRDHIRAKFPGLREELDGLVEGQYGEAQ